MKQKYGVTVSSSEINFYARNDMMDKISSESFDDSFRKIESHDKLVKALEECKHWHQGDKWRGSDDADQKGAWNRHMAIIDEALAAAKGE